MKTLTIGDTHGKDVADDVAKIIEKFDKVVFIGDYTDSFHYTSSEILYALSNIIGLKKKHKNKIVLLLGNHDMQYMFPDIIHRCSGYRPEAYPELNDVFVTNKPLFNFAYQAKDVLWTHAGVSSKWYSKRFKEFAELYPDLNLAQQLNLAFIQKYEALFDVGYARGGSHIYGSPVWADKTELTALSSPVEGLIQIVGHTASKEIKILFPNKREIVFVDVLMSKQEFYEREI